MKKIDKALVASTFAELKSKRETAKHLGISEESVYAILRGLSERCVRCGVPVKTGRQCPDCRNFDRQRMKDRRVERSRLGLCQQCGSQRSPLSKLFCEPHRIAAVDRNRKYEKKTRAYSSKLKAARTIARRQVQVRSRYGQHALEAWLEHGGACEICHTVHGEASVQIHHLDEDRKNNARANLAVLCFDCHQATHRLLVLKARDRFLTWFRRTYAR